MKWSDPAGWAVPPLPLPVQQLLDQRGLVLPGLTPAAHPAAPVPARVAPSAHPSPAPLSPRARPVPSPERGTSAGSGTWCQVL